MRALPAAARLHEIPRQSASGELRRTARGGHSRALSGRVGPDFHRQPPPSSWSPQVGQTTAFAVGSTSSHARCRPPDLQRPNRLARSTLKMEGRSRAMSSASSSNAGTASNRRAQRVAPGLGCIWNAVPAGKFPTSDGGARKVHRVQLTRTISSDARRQPTTATIRVASARS